MADRKVLFVNDDGLYEEHSESGDSIKLLSLKTANYELTDAKLGHLVDGADSADEHIHDARYFRENEFIGATTGASDANKPIQTNASGVIDSSFLNDSDISHDSTAGMATSTGHTAFPLLVGGRDFTAIQGYDSHKTFTADTDMIDKKYVDDKVSSTVTLGEWQASVLNIQTDATLDPSGAPTTGDRYILENVAALHANFGTITGVTDDDIVQYDGTAFVIACDPTEGTRVGNDANTNLLYFYSTSSGWQGKAFESTTASLGCKKNGYNIEADLVASGGIELVSNSMRVNAQDFDGEGLVASAALDLAIDWSTAFNDSKAVKASDLSSVASGLGASIIGVEDTNGFFTGTDVETVLAEIWEAANAGSGIDMTAGAGGVSAGDLVYISANNTVLPYTTLSSNVPIIGMALEDIAAGSTIKVAKFDSLITGVLTGATAGTRYFWTAAGLSTTQPTGNVNSYIGGIAKNATDLVVSVEHTRRRIG